MKTLFATWRVYDFCGSMKLVLFFITNGQAGGEVMTPVSM